jgi:hypothetical protein
LNAPRSRALFPRPDRWAISTSYPAAAAARASIRCEPRGWRSSRIGSTTSAVPNVVCASCPEPRSLRARSRRARVPPSRVRRGRARRSPRARCPRRRTASSRTTGRLCARAKGARAERVSNRAGAAPPAPVSRRVTALAAMTLLLTALVARSPRLTPPGPVARPPRPKPPHVQRGSNRMQSPSRSPWAPAVRSPRPRRTLRRLLGSAEARAPCLRRAAMSEPAGTRALLTPATRRAAPHRGSTRVERLARAPTLTSTVHLSRAQPWPRLARRAPTRTSTRPVQRVRGGARTRTPRPRARTQTRTARLVRPDPTRARGAATHFRRRQCVSFRAFGAAGVGRGSPWACWPR